MPADRERHVAAGALDLGRELDAGRGGADHQHRAVGKLPGIAVGGGHDLDDVRREGRGERRDGREVAVPGGDHDARGAPRAGGRLHAEPGVGRAPRPPPRPPSERAPRRSASSPPGTGSPRSSSCNRPDPGRGTTSAAGGSASAGSGDGASPTARCASARRRAPARGPRGRCRDRRKPAHREPGLAGSDDDHVGAIHGEPSLPVRPAGRIPRGPAGRPRSDVTPRSRRP